MNKDLISSLFESDVYKLLLKEIESIKPVVPPWEPTHSNIERMKYDSARLQMYDAIMGKLNPFRSEDGR